MTTELDPIVTLSLGVGSMAIGFLMLVYRRHLSALYLRLQRVGYPPFQPCIFAGIAMVCFVFSLIFIISALRRL